MGVRTGLLASAEMLRGHGHAAHVIDQYDGLVFDDYDAGLGARGGDRLPGPDLDSVVEPLL